MTSPILDALPGIHVTVIGVGAAFFSAFAMFAYQKVQETKDQLDKVLQEVIEFSTPNNFIGGGKNDLLKENGELDWDGKTKELLHHAKSLYSYLDYEEKYGIQRDRFSREPDNKDVIDTCRKLCLMFHYLFVTYPFTGRSMVHIEGITERIEERKAQPFDSHRLQEIERRISFLLWCWDTNNLALMELTKNCTKIEKERAEREAISLFEQSIANMPDLPEEEKKRIWDTFHQPRLKYQIDYSQILVDYFHKVSLYRDKVLPSLREALHSHRAYNERFKVKASTLLVIKLIVFNLVFGVLIPLILQNLHKDIGISWLSSFEYFLLFITTAPYFYVCRYLYKKIKTLSFE